MSEAHSPPLIIPDPSLILLIGPAGAGKSTFARRFFQPTEIVSSDHCRALICDDESNQEVNARAFDLLHRIARLRLGLRRLTVIDATNLQYQARRRLLRIASQHQLPAVAIAFKVSLATCFANNRARPHRTVGEETIRQHASEFSRALASLESEGYQSIFVLDEKELVNAAVERS